MGITKQTNIKIRTYYFYNDLINIKDFYQKLLKLDKKSYKNIDIYNIGYIIKNDEYKINSVNPLYLLVHRIDGSIKEKRGNKYFNIAFTDSNNSQPIYDDKYIKTRVKIFNNMINTLFSGDEIMRQNSLCLYCSNLY